MTQETGGEIFVTSVTNVDAAMATAIARLKLRYTLSYAHSGNSARSYYTVNAQLVDRFGKSGSDYAVHSCTGYFGGPVHATPDKQ